MNVYIVIDVSPDTQPYDVVWEVFETEPEAQSFIETVFPESIREDLRIISKPISKL